MEELLERIKKLEALLMAATLRIAELEAQLGQNSGNSSKPPSSDMPRKRRTPKEPSQRKAGGQPGHKGTTRELLPVSEVEVVERDPEQCEKCGESLAAAPRLDAFIRQIWEMPAFKAFVQQFNLWRKACQKCGHITRGQMPEGSPTGAFGPRLQAQVGLLSGSYRMTRREVVSLSKALFNVPISLGSVQATCEAVSEASAETAEAIHAELKKAKSVHADESGYMRCKKVRLWMWVIASGDAEAFCLLPGRGLEQAKELLGERYSGILHRDRWRPYEKFFNALHQLCLAHIDRDFQSMLESGGETGTQGCMLKLASDRAFHLWHEFERKEIDRAELIRRMKPVQSEIKERLKILRDSPETTKKARGTAKDLLRQWESMWTYVTHEGAVPTNNEAERSIRKAVLWRRVSQGVNSDKGARFVERMLTLGGTAKRRGIDFFNWLTQATQARFEGTPAPVFRA